MAPTNDCTHCGKAGALLRCPHVNPDGTPSFTPYCSKACQAADWPNHKTTCQQSKQRAQLFQAGELFKALALAFCEKGNFYAIDRIEVTAESINLYDGPPTGNPLGQDFTKFTNLNEEQKAAAVSMAGMPLLTRALHWMAHYTLSDFGRVHLRMVNVKQSLVKVRQSRPKAHDRNGKPIHFRPNPILTAHLILLVQLKDGLEYIVNPLGSHITSPSQHPVSLWSTYQQTFVEDVVARYCDLTPPSMAAPDPAKRPDKVYVDKAMIEMQRLFPRDVMAAAIKKPKQAFEREMADMVVRTRQLMDQASQGAKKNIKQPKFGRNNPRLLRQMEELAQDGRTKCGMGLSAQIKAEEAVLEELRQRYGSDPILVEMVKQARTSQTTDDFAEVGNRCDQIYLQGMVRTTLRMQDRGTSG